MTLDFCKLREQSGLELSEIAAEFDEPIDSVWRWENGEIAPPDRVLRSLAIMADFSGRTESAHSDICSLALSAERSPVDRPTARQRKSQLGQFMTPESVADFMASLFGPTKLRVIRLLDAGAGHGALTTAFVERVNGGSGPAQVHVTAFEFDEKILDDLRGTLVNLARRAAIQYELISTDFIEEAADRICLRKGERYTHAVLNPPYKKISTGSRHRALLRAAGLETVNLYTGFVGLALKLLKPGGELVAIIPRSFCNGPYYQPFRRLILRHAAIRHIHLFESRTTTFKKDGVLQENIIIKLVRSEKQGNVIVSTSTDNSFGDYKEWQHPFDRIVFPDDDAEFIHIPISDEKQLLERASFGHSLGDLDLTVSTGPVVDFRLRENLRADPEHDTVPLLYPGHFAADGLEWPKPGFKKPNAICHTAATRKWLYPNGHYAVVRRFSSKEERRRIVANVVDPARLPSSMIGIENHLNVFHANRQPISEDLAHGLATYLNSTAVDTYFRRFSGHTQVNATDLRAMRYPTLSALIALGQWAKRRHNKSQDAIDEQVSHL